MRIFSTRKLDEQAMAYLPQACQRYDEADFIRIEHHIEPQDAAQIKAWAQAPLQVIITSKQAVHALRNLNIQPLLWKIWCIEPVTRRWCADWLGAHSIAHSAIDAEALCLHIQSGAFVFFSGNVVSEVIPNHCKEKNIPLTRIEVYQQFPQPQTLSTQYDYYLFFSPGAVDSFFSANTLPAEAKAVAIGKATQKRLEKYGHKHNFTAPEPSAKAMLELIDYDYNA